MTQASQASWPLEVVCATANLHKVRELSAMLGNRVHLLPRPASVGDIAEDGATLEDNARIKADTICAAIGSAALADDTGLEVDALGGAPGVHSARYAGESADAKRNVALLLAELERMGARTPAQRTARFRTVLVIRSPDRSEVVAEGTVEGHIVTTARGEHGFGYDPVFEPIEGDGRTFAELNESEKNAISHRARAVDDLLRRLAE